MAEQVIDLGVDLELKDLPGCWFEAVVTDVKDQILELKDVVRKDNGTFVEKAVISSGQIKEIRVTHVPERLRPSSHIDPAILGYDRASSINTSSVLPITPAVLPQASNSVQDLKQLASPSPSLEHNLDRPDISEVQALGIKGKIASGAQRRQQQQNERQRSRGKRTPDALQESAGTQAVQQANVQPTQPKSAGWRQTPLLEEVPQMRNGTPGRNSKVAAIGSNKRKSKREKALEREAQRNGWATEDATDVQEMGEFDFEANLSKFDKKSVWTQLREEDTTADEDRLVSFNRIDQRKLRPTENVLEHAQLRRRRSSKDTAVPLGHGDETFSSDEEFADEPQYVEGVENTASRPMIRNASRTSAKVSSHPNSSLLRRESSLIGRRSGESTSFRSNMSGRSLSQTKQPSDLRTTAIASPTLRDPPPYSPTLPHTSRNLDTNSSSRPRPCLRYTTNDRMCPTLSPATLRQVEQIALSPPLSLSSDIILENAARNVAEIALSLINPGNRRLASASISLNARPVIVVLAADNEAGTRAVGAAAHLRERGVRIVAAIVGLASNALLDLESFDPGSFSSSLGYNIARLMMAGGCKVMSWSSTQSYLKSLLTPPELIIDGLLDVHTPPSLFLGPDAGPAQRKEFLSMLAWANKSKASCLAVDIPSGVHPETGEVEVLEGEPAEVRARVVVCSGVPVTGLLRAMQDRAEDWRVAVGDVGLNPALRAWGKDRERRGRRRAGTGGKTSVGFGSGWVVGVRFDDGEGATAADEANIASAAA